ncbi:hypothetical protein D3C80_1485350 [compost metagenome]
MHLDPRLAQQHTAAGAAPHRLLAIDQQQAATFALCRQPQAITSRVYRQAFEQGIEMQQHAAGPGLTNHARIDLQPVRLTVDWHLQHGGVGFTDHIAIAGGITGDGLEIQVATTHLASGPRA